MKTIVPTPRAVCFLIAAFVSAGAAPTETSPEDHYVALRDAAIEKLKSIYDAGNIDDAEQRPRT